MIVDRSVFQAKSGKADELVALFKEVGDKVTWARNRTWRVLTDRSGPFDTVVLETEWESLGEWEKNFAQMFSDPELRDILARSAPLVESGRREFYNVET
jgi:hypothetical protein